MSRTDSYLYQEGKESTNDQSHTKSSCLRYYQTSHAGTYVYALRFYKNALWSWSLSSIDNKIFAFTAHAWSIDIFNGNVYRFSK